MDSKFAELDHIPVPDDSDVLFHYTTFEALEKMLECKKLRFSSIGDWQIKGDEFEGTYTTLVHQYLDMFLKLNWSGIEENLSARQNEFEEKQKIRRKNLLNHLVFANSWTLDHEDTEHMWKTFKAQVAIQTTYRKLKEEFKRQVNLIDQIAPESATAGLTVYVPNDAMQFEKGNDDIYFFKRSNYQNEKELRLFFKLTPIHRKCPRSEKDKYGNPNEFLLPFNWGNVIDHIVPLPSEHLANQILSGENLGTLKQKITDSVLGSR